MVSIDQSIPALTERLERKFGVQIEADECLKEQRLTWIQPKTTNVQDALGDIYKLADCQVESVSDGFLMRPISE